MSTVLRFIQRGSLMPLPASYFLWLIAILLSYSLLTQLVKLWYIRRFHTWL